MKNTLKKISTVFTLFLGTLFSLAQMVPPPPPTEQASPGPGGPATPIDGYVYLMALVVSFILFFYKNKLSLSKKNQ